MASGSPVFKVETWKCVSASEFKKGGSQDVEDPQVADQVWSGLIVIGPNLMHVQSHVRLMNSTTEALTDGMGEGKVESYTVALELREWFSIF